MVRGEDRRGCIEFRSKLDERSWSIPLTTRRREQSELTRDSRQMIASDCSCTICTGSSRQRTGDRTHVIENNGTSTFGPYLSPSSIFEHDRSTFVHHCFHYFICGASERTMTSGVDPIGAICYDNLFEEFRATTAETTRNLAKEK